MQIKTRLVIFQSMLGLLILGPFALVFFAPYVYAQPAPVKPVSDCEPMVLPLGQGTVAPVSIGGEEGFHQFIFCANPKPTWKGFSCRISECMRTDTPRLIYAAARSAKPLEEFDRLWNTYVTWSCTAPPDEPKRLLCEEQKRLGDAELAKHLVTYVPPVWRVKANGTATTRPGYELADGKLGLEAARAPIGVACDLTKPTIAAPYTRANLDIRAQWAGGPDGVVTICTRGN